jgi:hypothetical protein
MKEALSRQDSDLRQMRKRDDSMVSSFLKLVELCFSRRFLNLLENDLFDRSSPGALFLATLETVLGCTNC